jgi:hypothetical protein
MTHKAPASRFGMPALTVSWAISFEKPSDSFSRPHIRKRWRPHGSHAGVEI